MSRGSLDLVIERLVIEGLELPPERAAELGRLIEAELRPLIAGGGAPVLTDGSVTSAQPVSLAQPVDLRALARTLATRIAISATQAGGGHV